MWVRPLQAELNDNTHFVCPNRFVLDWVRDKYINNINLLLKENCGNDVPSLRFEVGSKPVAAVKPAPTRSAADVAAESSAPAQPAQRRPVHKTWDDESVEADITYRSNVNPKHISSITSLKVNRTS